MKAAFLFSFALLFSTILFSQNITGIWRGGFHSGTGIFASLQYKYEVQLHQMKNAGKQKGLEGVTYSYQSTSFYGKSLLQGIYDPSEHNITIKETRLVELKIGKGIVPCLMTCYLEYRREGKKEILSGNFSSVMVHDKSDCGSGVVYLEKVTESDFHKEDFLVKKRPPVFQPPIAKPKPQPKKVVPATPSVPEKEKEREVQRPIEKPESDITKISPIPEKPAIVERPLPKKEIPVPEEIRSRENPLIKTITTDGEDIIIQLYDNGEIDGDTITVYHNNQVIAYRKGLTREPITLKVKAASDNGHHEFVMVANNLGSIPPNTALMVITTGGKRYEVFVSSDEKKNAKVVIEYRKPD